MTSLPAGEQENFFLLNEQPSINFHQTETFNGIKSIQRILSASSSILSTQQQQQQQPHQSLTSRDLTPPLHLSSAQSNDIDSYVRHFERRFDDHRLLWKKEYDRKTQQITDSKNNEINSLKVRYETKIHGLEDRNRQLEISSGQINEENKRLKIEIEHEKEKNRIEQTSMQQHFKEFESEIERKLHETKLLHENEKQELKRQHTRTYQDLLEETNQRLKQMENDYKHKHSTNESMVEEMDTRMMDLRSNVENLQQIKQKLDEDKIQLVKNNEQLQLQVQELTNKQRHIDLDHTSSIQRYENEIKSVRLRYDSNADLLRKENDILKSKSTKTIDDLETKLSTITEKFGEIQRLFDDRLKQQQINYHNNIKQCENDYERKIQTLKQELKEFNNKYLSAIQQNEQLKQQKNDLEDKMQDKNHQTRENEQRLINKLKLEYEQVLQHNEEKSRQNYNKEIQEIKRKSEQTIEKMNNDLQEINKLHRETKFAHTNEKQKLRAEYEQFIRQLEKQFSQKTDEYEKRIEIIIAKTHEQFKSMEDELGLRNTKQQATIDDQQKLIQTLKDEQNKAKLLHEKQYATLSEQSSHEKNEIKAQFDLCMKNFEKNFNILTSKKEQLERKLVYLTEQHKHEMVECRLLYENNIKGLLSNDVRADLENTIHSLKQQVVYLQQRIAFLQRENEQYIRIYGHRPPS